MSAVIAIPRFQKGAPSKDEGEQVLSICYQLTGSNLIPHFRFPLDKRGLLV